MKATRIWTIRERDTKTGLVVAERKIKNITTNYGLTALAMAPGGGYVNPNYLVMDSTKTTLVNAAGAGTTSVLVNSRIDQTSDTQIVVGVGLSTQEVVTFSTSAAYGSYWLYTTSALVYSHSASEVVTRNPLASDTLANVLGEIQYDSVNSPNTRIQSPASYSPGVGQGTMQFYMSATQAVSYIALMGLADSPMVGQGNLHAYLVVGQDHTPQTNDLELDITLTLTNG